MENANIVGLSGLLFIVGILAISEIISIKSRGVLSLMLMSAILFLAAFFLGVPRTIYGAANLDKVGNILIALLITHLGTNLNLKSVIQQWKTVIIAFSAELGIILFVLLGGSLFFDKVTTLSSISPIGGGIVATLLVQKAATSQGLDYVVIFTTLMLSASSFVGFPLASFLLKKEAKSVLKIYRNSSEKKKFEKKEEKNTFFEIPFISRFTQKYSSAFIMLAKVSFSAWLAFFIADFTGGILNGYVICLIIGFIFKEIGFLEIDILVKANSYGLTMLAVLSVIFARFNTITTDMILNSLLPILTLLLLGILGMIIFAYFVGKLLKIRKLMSISIGIACMFGFPGTHVIPHEIAQTLSENEEEKQFILSQIYPPMLISGFVNVTIASVVIASLVIRFL